MADTWEIPLSVLTKAFPNDLLLKYVIVPTAVNTWWALAAVTGFLLFHYYACIVFSNGDVVCSKRTKWLFAVEFGLYGLMCYTWFLKCCLTRRWVIEREREEELEKEASPSGVR